MIQQGCHVMYQSAQVKMRTLFFICSFCMATVVHAQDSLKSDPSRPRLYIALDYGKLATLPTNFETKVEGGIGVRIARSLTLVGHAGYASLEPNNAIENGTYTSTGLYFRTGFDYHFNLDNTNYLSIGARYGWSSFEEELSYIISSDLFEDISENVERGDISAQWAEITFGSESRLGAGRFYAGGYLSLRILISRDEFDPTDTYTIPGYGRTFDKTIPAIQLYLKVIVF